MEKKLQSGKATPQEICRQALEHYEKISKECCNWLSTIPAALKIYEQYLDLKGWPEDEIEKVLAHHLKPEYGWHFEAPYLGYSFEPIKIIAGALSNKIPKLKKIEKEEIARAMDSALGYEGIGARMTSEEIDKVTSAIQKLFRERVK